MNNNIHPEFGNHNDIHIVLW